MKGGQVNAHFLKTTTEETKRTVLANIAHHYGISEEEALREVTSDDAEHLLDYVTGPTRMGISVLMQRAALAS